jgi:hypothetical protein
MDIETIGEVIAKTGPDYRDGNCDVLRRRIIYHHDGETYRVSCRWPDGANIEEVRFKAEKRGARCGVGWRWHNLEGK